MMFGAGRHHGKNPLSEIDRKTSRLDAHYRVDLISINIQDEHMQYLCQKQTHKIKDLCLGCCGRIQSATVSRIRAFKAWFETQPRSQVQQSAGNNLESKGCKMLTRVNLPKLEEINLGHTHLRSEALLHLSKARLPQLKELILDYNPMKVCYFRYISKTSLPKLTKFQLQGFNAHDRQQLLCSVLRCEWPSLVYLNLTASRWSQFYLNQRWSIYLKDKFKKLKKYTQRF